MMNESIIEHVDENFKPENIIVKKSKKTRCKVCIKKSLICSCVLSILVLTHYIAFSVGYGMCYHDDSSNDS